MNDAVRVLYVNQGALGQAMVRTLENERIEPVPADSGVDVLKRIDVDPIDIVIVPESLPDIGIDLDRFIARVQSIQPDVTIVVFGEVAGLPTDVISVPKDEFGRSVLSRLEEIIADWSISRALDGQDRLEAVAFNIAHESTTATTPEAILDAVYDHLTKADLYHFVWVGQYDPETDTIRGRRPFAGEFTSSSVAQTLGLDDTDIVAEAIDSGAVKVTTESGMLRAAATTQPDADARTGTPDRTLSHAVVPFMAGDRTRALAFLTANRTDAFDRTERSFLGKLGEVVGQSLMSIERKAPTVQTNPERIKQLVDLLAHELRNPLTIAESYLELGRERDDDDAFERVANAHTAIEEIIDAVVRMAEAGGVDEVADVELISLATDVWQQLPTESAELTLGTPATVEADPDLLGRLLTNLMKNAIDHGGSDVRIRVGALTDAPGFYVEDDGPGIPEAERDTIFEWGYSTGEEHLGIGLGFVREIAEAHGWEVTISESPDGGARFAVITGATETATDGGASPHAPLLEPLASTESAS